MHRSMPTPWVRRTGRTEPGAFQAHARTAWPRGLLRQRGFARPKERGAPPCALSKSRMPVPAVDRPASRSPPTCAPAAHVNMSEGTMMTRAAVNANAARQLGMLLFHFLDGLEDDLGVAGIHAPVVIQICHASRAIIDVHIRGVSIHVPTQLGAAADAAPMPVVPGRSEAAHHHHTLYVNSILLESRNDQLEL